MRMRCSIYLLVIATALPAACSPTPPGPNVPAPALEPATPARKPSLPASADPLEAAEHVPVPDGGGDTIVLDNHGQRVVRLGSDKPIKWSTTLEGYLGLVRPPHLQANATLAFITHADGVTALDVATGAVAWRSPGPADRMLLSGDLLLATDCGSSAYNGVKERFFIARATSSGKEAFRVKLPLENFDPLAVRELVGLFLVQDHDRPGGEGNAFLVDRSGRIRHHFDKYVVTAEKQADGCLFLTGHGVIRTAGGDKVLWTLPFKHKEWLAGGGLLPLPGSDVLAFVYCRIADSGVQLHRFNPESGQRVWQANCSPLGVGHSEYSHEAEVVLADGRLRVTSRGSSGTFVEEIDERTGRSLSRVVQR